MYSWLYQIYNDTDSMVYIGATTQIKERVRAHRYHLRRNTHPNKNLQKAWNALGESSFNFIVLEEGDFSSVTELHKREEQWFHVFAPSIYNYDNHTRAFILNQPPSAETLARMREVNLGKRASEETKRKMGDKQKARFEDPLEREKSSRIATENQASPEYRQRMRESLLETWQDPRMDNERQHRRELMQGKKFSEKDIETMRQAQRKRFENPDAHKVVAGENNAAAKTWKKKYPNGINLISPDGCVVNVTYLSGFAKENGLSLQGLSNLITGFHKSTKGWTLAPTEQAA